MHWTNGAHLDVAIYQVAENFFCLFFFFEWGARFMAFQRKRDSLKACCCVLSLTCCGPTNYFRMGRGILGIPQVRPRPTSWAFLREMGEPRRGPGNSPRFP